MVSAESFRSELRLRREAVKLHKAPFTTIYYLLLSIWEGIVSVIQYGFQSQLVSSIVLLLTGLTLATWFLPDQYFGEHVALRAIVREESEFILGWFVLGVLSSIGLGSGLHTFLLFLGPYIIRIAATATMCNRVDFSTSILWKFDSFQVVSHPPDAWKCEPAGGEPISIFDIFLKVEYSSLIWGLGTACGELPPYFIARAAALKGERLKELEESLAAQEGESKLMHKAKETIFEYIQKYGFVAIMLLASVPNPLFDLAGLTCGHFLVPFATFFGALILGKAIIKTCVQSIFFVSLINRRTFNRIEYVIQNYFSFFNERFHIVESMEKFTGNLAHKSCGDKSHYPHPGQCETCCSKMLDHEAQKKICVDKCSIGKVPANYYVDLVKYLWGWFIVAMIGFFVYSLIDSTVQHYLSEIDEEKLALFSNSHIISDDQPAGGKKAERGAPKTSSTPVVAAAAAESTKKPVEAAPVSKPAETTTTKPPAFVRAPRPDNAPKPAAVILTTCGSCGGKGAGLVTNSNGMCDHCNRTPIKNESSVATAAPVNSSGTAATPSAPVPAGTAEDLKNLGNNEFKAGKYEAALALYSAAVGKDPLMDTARLNKAAALLKMDRFAEAEAECSIVIKRNKRDVKALYRRGVALRGLGKYELAILDFEEVILNEPSNGKAKEEVRDTKALLKEREDAAAAKLATENALLNASITPVAAASTNAASATGSIVEGSLPSLGEAAAKNLESQNKALAAAERIKAKLLVKLPAAAPRNAAEFKRELYNLRKQPETFAPYLHMLPLDKIQPFFAKGGMDADILELSVASMRHHMSVAEQKDFIVTLLTEYSKVKSFKTACMVLEKKCTVELGEILASLVDEGVSGDAVSTLKKAYGL